MNDSRITPQRVCLITNLAAGQAATKAEAVASAVDIWRAHQWQVDIFAVHQPGDVQRFAAVALTQGYTMVVAAGGDGTVNEVANALIGSTVCMAPLPVGTVNVWAREAGFSMDIVTAAHQIVQSRKVCIDVGVLGERHFLLMAGIGFDAEVVRHLYPNHKQKFGVMAYIGRIWAVMWGYRSQAVTVTLDDEVLTIDLLMMVVGNTPKYASFIPFTPHAVHDDGMLDVTILTGRDLFTGPFRFLALYVRRWLPWLDRQVITRRVRSVRVGGATLAVQLDGDYVTHTPCQISILPQALHVLVCR